MQIIIFKLKKFQCEQQILKKIKKQKFHSTFLYMCLLFFFFFLVYKKYKFSKNINYLTDFTEKKKKNKKKTHIKFLNHFKNKKYSNLILTTTKKTENFILKPKFF